MAGGDGPPLYSELLQLVPGEYVSPAGDPQAEARGLSALRAEAGKAQFDGFINGIRLYSFQRAAADPSVSRQACEGEVQEFRPFEGLTFGYLPPGTLARGPQYVVICDDGSRAGYGQQFATLNTDFDVTLGFGELAFGHDATADRVRAATVAGRPGVVIAPLTEEGFGRAWVAVPLSGGLLVVDARNMPLDEVLKIAGGVKCAAC